LEYRSFPPVSEVEGVSVAGLVEVCGAADIVGCVWIVVGRFLVIDDGVGWLRFYCFSVANCLMITINGGVLEVSWRAVHNIDLHHVMKHEPMECGETEPFVGR
jgi:hypothetical protein